MPRLVLSDAGRTSSRLIVGLERETADRLEASDDEVPIALSPDEIQRLLRTYAPGQDGPSSAPALEIRASRHPRDVGFVRLRASSSGEVLFETEGFVGRHQSRRTRSYKQFPRVYDVASLLVAIRNRLDAFYVPHPAQVVSGTLHRLSRAHTEDVHDFERRTSTYLSDDLGLCVLHDASVVCQSCTQTRDGEYLAEALQHVRWISGSGGGAFFDRADDSFYTTTERADLAVSGALVILNGCNYGHWHTENVPALGIIRAQYAEFKALFGALTFSVPFYRTDRLVRSLFDQFNLFDGAIIDPINDGYVRVSAERVVVGSSLHALLPYRWHPKVSTYIQSLRCDRDPTAPEVVYVSRGDAGNMRWLLNEAELLDRLRATGIEVQAVNASTLSYGDQKRTFSNARLILAPHGSGETNALFSRRRASLVELSHTAIGENRVWYRNLAQNADIEFVYVTGAPSENEFQSGWAVDVEAVLETVPKLLEAR